LKEVILIPSFEPDMKLVELISTINRTRFDIVVVDDGSGSDYQDIFNKIKDKVHLISYEPNMGKGYALKKGMAYIKDTYQKDYIVITMDSDGQHTIADAIKLSSYAKNHKNTLVLGMRKRGDTTPLRSKIGNTITKWIYGLVTGVSVYDTQTGLRVFSDRLMDFLLSVDGNRFEYEMNSLLLAPKNGIRLYEIEIETIYYKKNKGTHFKTLRDSFLIYKDILKFSLSSILSFVIDYILFFLFSLFINSITLCNILARVISASFNYLMNRKYVFKSRRSAYKSIFQYAILATSMLFINTLLLNIFVKNFLMNKFIAKIIVEIILFIINYFVQKIIIFRKENDKN